MQNCLIQILAQSQDAVVLKDVSVGIIGQLSGHIVNQFRTAGKGVGDDIYALPQ